MPVISVNPSELIRFSKADEKELLSVLPKLGIDINSTDDERWELEVFPDRCDMLSLEGIGRAVKGFLGIEKNLPEYTVEPSEIVTEVELSVQDVRPFISTALVKNVKLSEEFLKSLMDIQEKLHMTLGRNRRKVAIGIHDFTDIEPPFTYKAVRPEEISFVPLQRTHKMTLKDILEKHEKGKDYAHILVGKERYPVILDSKDDILSFPPIINGMLTQVTSRTDTLFIDMTGTDESALLNTLNILCSMLADRGADIYSTTVSYGGREKVFPDLATKCIESDLNEARSLLGVSFDTIKASDAFERMGYYVKEISNNKATLLYPAYRHDILHPWDTFEDLAVGLDYEAFIGCMPRMVTIGKSSQKKELENTSAELLIGYGYNEVMNYPLSNPDSEYHKMRLQPHDEHTVLKNPVSEEQTCLRTWLLPSLLLNLKNNRNRSLPQRFFEIGDVVTDGEPYNKMAAVTCHSEAGFTEMKSMMEGLMKAMGIKFIIEPKRHDSFISGRCASLQADGKEFGFFGEIHPQVLSNFELEYPCSAFEIDLRGLG